MSEDSGRCTFPITQAQIAVQANPKMTTATKQTLGNLLRILGLHRQASLSFLDRIVTGIDGLQNWTARG